MVSYVPNSYFLFPYAQTVFDSEGACSSAVDACSNNYDACVSDLEGDLGFPVTIDVPGGGGTTVAGGIDLEPASATSVCSSLSSQACSDLESTSCDAFDSGSSSVNTRAQMARSISWLVGAYVVGRVIYAAS